MRLWDLTIVTEDRDPDIEYEERRGKKTVTPEEKTSPEDIDRVIAYLEGGESGKYTRLANQLRDVMVQLGQLKEIEKDLKDQFRNDAMEELFDVSDEMYTRVIETVSLTIQVSKASTRTSKKFDEAGFIKELLVMYPDMTKKIKKLKNKYTKVKMSNIAPRLKVDVKEATGDKNLWQKFINWIDNLTKQFKSWLRSYDYRLKTLRNNLKQAVNQAEEPGT